jgi:hypothetical protein
LAYGHRLGCGGSTTKPQHKGDALHAWRCLLPDCKAFKKLGLKATFYSDGDMLAAFPFKSHKAAHSSAPPPVPGARRHGSLQAGAAGLQA